MDPTRLLFVSSGGTSRKRGRAVAGQEDPGPFLAGALHALLFLAPARSWDGPGKVVSPLLVFFKRVSQIYKPRAFQTYTCLAPTRFTH